MITILLQAKDAYITAHHVGFGNLEAFFVTSNMISHSIPRRELQCSTSSIVLAACL